MTASLIQACNPCEPSPTCDNRKGTDRKTDKDGVTNVLGTVERRLTFLVMDGDGLWFTSPESSFTDVSICRLHPSAAAEAASSPAPMLLFLLLSLLLSSFVVVGNIALSLSTVRRTRCMSFLRLSSWNVHTNTTALYKSHDYKPLQAACCNH